MTSGNFTYLPVKSIIVNREDRQRRELTNIEELADSISRVGLINPIVVTQDHVLVAGERRLTAHQLLGFEMIAVQFAEDLSEIELQMIELEENVKRQELSWQDTVRAVAKFDKLKKQQEESWTIESTATNLGMSPTNVRRYLDVNRFIEEGRPEVLEAPKLSQAVNFAQRAIEREKTSVLRDLKPSPATPSATPLEPGVPVLTLTPEEVEAAVNVSRRAEILNESFTKWAKVVRTDPYNLIHCDFPYGVNTGDSPKGQSGGAAYGTGYDDSEGVYWELLEAFLKHQDNFCHPSAHMIFWFSMDFYEETRRQLKAGGWVVNPFPLIWSKGNTGIIPDANRGPRRVYETALFCTRGDRKIVRAVGNHVAAEVRKEWHVSEKPKAMLEHFLRMLVDETTMLLDPTCGSGNAVGVAESLGAHWATGLELNPEYAKAAKENLGLS